MLSLLIAVLLQTDGRSPDSVAQAAAYAAKYRERLPSLECDEAIDSADVRGVQVKKEVRIEGTFRVVRSGPETEPFVESHQFKTVNGGVVPKHFGIPLFLQGAFANGVGFNPAVAQCFDYAAGSASDRPGTMLIVVRAKDGVEKIGGCEKVPLGAVKKVWLDEGEKVMVRVESQLPARIAEKYKAPYFAEIDYGRVQIGQDFFWLPVRVASHDAKNEGRFEAHYTNFHRYGATVRILPDAGASK
jgi:hypothetical protein